MTKPIKSSPDLQSRKVIFWKKQFYPGDEIWSHPDVEALIESINRTRRSLSGKPWPLPRNAATADMLRERLWENEAMLRKRARARRGLRSNTPSRAG